MKKILAAFLLCLALPGAAAAQPSPEEGEAAVRAVIDRLFDGMRAGDSSAVRATFAPSMRLMTVAAGKNDRVQLHGTPARRFVEAVGQPHDAQWDERIWGVEIRRDGPLASAWVPYAFYLGDRLSHCGTNAFQLAKLEGEWQIVQITDTRRTDCEAFVPEAVQQGEQ